MTRTVRFVLVVAATAAATLMLTRVAAPPPAARPAVSTPNADAVALADAAAALRIELAHARRTLDAGTAPVHPVAQPAGEPAVEPAAADPAAIAVCEAAADRARAIVTAAEARGRWSHADAAAMYREFPALSREQRDELTARIGEAVTAGRLVPVRTLETPQEDP